MEIISKKKAIEQGLDLYFTGKPCKRGHLSERYVKSRCCVQCQEQYRLENKEKHLEYWKNRYESNKEDILEYWKEYRENNKEIISERAKIYHENNRTQIIARVKTYVQNNKEHVSEYQKTYRQENLDVVRHHSAKRRARHKQAVVEWADNNKIKEIYTECEVVSKSIGVVHHVDHIVPLTHKLVCGLHNEFNLQVLTAKENLAKKNCYWPDMPDDVYEALKFYYHE
jgi:hypothetical protein